ncbi:hypothetical protein PsorP6_006916 [Peronosclerospora sorghi]|uniref:Uncharacterized protein n=1 Tax=Peronosclerospora sorghi TaxID=230839 RepID=A0ACC0W9F7_9STRA|nr:hypothetical protein PsorP6_006916 [Peronosclerospora sorghi]
MRNLPSRRIFHRYSAPWRRSPPTFKAYEYSKYGDPLEEITLNPQAPQQPLKRSELRVQIFSAALNPVDFKLVTYGPHILPHAPTAENPFRVGFDMAGEVVEVGSDVTDYQVGDEIFGMPGFENFGTFAEYINIDTKYVVPKPRTMSWNEAAGVPLAGETIWQALVTYGKLQKGQRVLILGGSSGTGVFGIQIAKAIGAEVITTCSHRNVELVKSLGAVEVIDYTKEKWSDVVAEHSDPIPSPIGATLHQIFNTPCSDYLFELKKLIEAGKIKTIIDSVHPPEDVMKAIKLQMTGRARGKIIIEIVKTP